MSCDRVVMVVEDDRDVRESLAEILEDYGYGTMWAGNGQEALARLRGAADKPCLILLDIMMPIMDGRQFRAVQRDDPALSGIPIVIITAHGDAERAATDMAVAGWLRKPVKLEPLLAMIARFCGTAA